MVKILSYNIYFKAMRTETTYQVCQSKSSLIYNNCLKNVSDFIQENGPYDFVGLQEATNWSIINKITPTLSAMHHINIKSTADAVEEIVTFYSKDYELDKTENILYGHMADINRPFVILFFKNKLCVINLHAGHYVPKIVANTNMYSHIVSDIYNFDHYLEKVLETNKTADIFIDKLQTYDIIMMGDFNDDLGKFNDDQNFIILKNKFLTGRKLYGVNKKASCCDNTLMANNLKKSFDQILTTFSNNYSKVINVKQASDHMPIIAIVSKNIGYDFDGVLHTSVGKADASDQRNAINIEGPYNPFNEIIDQIKKELRMGHNISIITARTNDDINFTAVEKHLDDFIGKNIIDNKISVYFTDGQNKTAFLKKLKINTFYDDSCLRIKELHNSQQFNQLPYLTQLFFVDPDKHLFVLIDDDNINKICRSRNQLISELIALQNYRDNHNNGLFFEKSNKIINKIISDYGYKLNNPNIKMQLRKLNNMIDSGANINLVDRIQRNIITMIVKDLKN